MPRLLITDDAREDMWAIWLFIAQDNPSVADRLVDRIDRTLQLLAANTKMGEAVDYLRSGIRRFRVGNYLLFFEAIDDGIRLMRVYHASRRLDKLFE